MTYYLELFICGTWTESLASEWFKGLVHSWSSYETRGPRLFGEKQKYFKRIMCIVLSQNKGWHKKKSPDLTLSVNNLDISNLWHHLRHQLCVIKKTKGGKKNQAFGCISAEQVGDGTEQTLFLWVPEKLTFFRPPRLTATLSPVVRTGGAQKKRKRRQAPRFLFKHKEKYVRAERGGSVLYGRGLSVWTALS